MQIHSLILCPSAFLMPCMFSTLKTILVKYQGDCASVPLPHLSTAPQRRQLKADFLGFQTVLEDFVPCLFGFLVGFHISLQSQHVFIFF